MRKPNGAPLAYSAEDGEAAVRVARAAVEAAVRGVPFKPPTMPEPFQRNAGVFATLNAYPSLQLRGCVGFAEPVMPLARALIEAARAAALEDTRFRPVGEDELESLVVEVSLLTPPNEIPSLDRAKIPGLIEVGRHGLIVRRGRQGGLLLPQVATEWRWDAEEFLAQTCRKAGLAPGDWRDGGTRVFAFEAAVFGEKSPGGPVSRHGPSGSPGD